MKIVELNDKTFPGVLFEAVQTVKDGGVIVYPTDTVYGIGGNALNAKVAERIYRIKDRSRDKAFILLVKDHAQARKYAYIDLWTEHVLEELWPGPVSVVLHKKDVVPDIAAGDGKNIALRMPKHRFSEELLRQIDVPMIATSANRSEDSTPVHTLDSFLEYLWEIEEKPDLVINAGPLSGEPSTLLDLTNRKSPLILRKGILTQADLEKILQHQNP